ncbi:MAG: signal recognition particle receptor subunit alpha, partial [Alphaproteobacteria bacterium]|nr:signal recognition particle receptor subunit alpha [Alphaproteobacteria bacterium]
MYIHNVYTIERYCNSADVGIEFPDSYSSKGYMMFDNLSRRLSTTFMKITGRTQLTADMLDDAFSEIRSALLEADVALPVVKKILAEIKEKSIGQ